VDARVRSSGPHGRHHGSAGCGRADAFGVGRNSLVSEELGERVFDVALDGADVALAREAVEGGPVVCEVDPEVQLVGFS